MKTAQQHMLRLVAVLALTAASTSAFAQSADYRRGYDDGYAAAQREGGGHRGERGDRGRRSQQGVVRIEEALYGARGAVCDALPAARNEFAVNRGIIRAGNQLCGDPARGEPKRLNIVYRCGNSESMRVSARERETLRLTCER